MARKPRQGKIRKLCKKGKYKALLRAVPQEELRRGFEPDRTQPIHYFAARGNLQAVRELIETYKCNPECQNVHGITPLHCASYCGRLSVVKCLVEEHKCDANVRDEKGACPLAYASYCVLDDITLKCPLDVFQEQNERCREHIETAKFLLSFSTLQSASLANDLCILRLQLSCDLSSFEDFKQLESILNLSLGDNSPELSAEVAKCLEIALSSEESKSEFVGNLLRMYAKYTTKDSEQTLTPILFHKACSKADINVIKIFFELDICKPDVHSVKIAIDRKDYELVQFLLLSADHPLLLDEFVRDDLKWSTSMLYYIFDQLMHDQKLIKLAFDSTVGIEVRDSKGNNPLHLLCQHSDISIPGIVAEQYSSYQFMLNNNQELPVHIACEGENLELIKAVSSQLQEKDMNTQDIHGNTPLHVMCKSPSYSFFSYSHYNDTHIECLKYLIHEKKCDMNIQNNLGELPIHIVVKVISSYYCKSKSLPDPGNQIDSDDEIDIEQTDSDQVHIEHINSDQMFSDHIYSDQIYRDQTYSDQFYSDEDDSEQIDTDQTDSYLIDIDQSDSDRIIDSDQIDSDQIDSDQIIDSDHDLIYTGQVDSDDYIDTDQFLIDSNNQTVIELITSGKCFNINAQDSVGNTPLHLACEIGDKKTVVYLFSKFKCDLNISNSEGCIPLYYALSSYNCLSLKVVELVSNGCTMKCKQNSVGKTPLHIACEKILPYMDNNERKNLMIDLAWDKENINVQDNEGNTPLHIACQQHDLETAVYLTSHYQCDFDLVNNDHCLALHYAVSSYFNRPCSLDLVKVVSKCKMMHMLNSKGMTPLHIACENEDLDVVKYFVFGKKEFLSSYETSSAIYYTLEIHLACEDKNDIDLLKALANKSNVNNKACDESTPLHVACENGNDLAVKLLLELNCDTLCKDSQGRLPFHVACSKSLECVKEMFPYITNDVINNCEENGNTPLHIALMNNRLDIVNFLLSNFQCNFSIKNSEGEFPTHLVCSTTLSVVRIVTGKSAAQNVSINCQTQQDNTPLHIACQFGALDIVEYLTESFDCEPSMRLRNKEGKLPVDYACEHSLEMVKLVCQPCTIEDLVSPQYQPVISSRGFNHNYKHKQMLTTLDIACKIGYLDIARYLTKEKGCTLSALNNNHRALGYACGLQVRPYDSKDTPKPHTNIVRFLIHECGYNPGQTVSGTSFFRYSCKINSLQLMKAVPIYQLDSQDRQGNTPLHYACKYDSVDIVKYLVDCGCNQNTVNNNGDSPLHMACRSSLEVTKCLTKCDVNLKNADGYTPLHIASVSKKNDIALYLIEEMNCDLKLKNNEGTYPLHIACSNSMQIIIDKIVEKSDINCKNNYGDTPLHNACYKRDIHMIRFLLSYPECRADIVNEVGDLALHLLWDSNSLLNVRHYRQHKSNLAQMVELILKRCSAAAIATNHDGRTPIDLAIMNGELRVFEVLLSVGEVDEVTRQRLLHTACEHGQPEIVDWLITQGASTDIANDDDDYPQHVCIKTHHNNRLEMLTQLGVVDARQLGKNNDTILHLACRQDFEVHVLLKYILQTHRNCKKAFSMQNMNTYTPLHVLATCRNRYHRFFKVSQDVLTLIECDNPNLQDKFGNTPLHLACQDGRCELAEHLITKCNCDPNVTNDKGEIPLHIATAQSQMKIIELLASNENVNKCTNSGDSPLHIACKTNNLDATNMLLGLHSNPTIPNNQGNTPFHVAVTQSLEIVKLVATSGNTNLQNHNGDTPFHIACSGENMNIIIFLLKELKCSVEILNKDFESAFHILFNNWHYHDCSSELQKSLLNYIPQHLKDISSKTGETILHIACRKANHKVVMYLVEMLMCKVDTGNKHSGATALHFACKRDSLSVVQLVTGCNPTAKIKDVSYLPKETELVSGDTPLHVACRERNLDVIRHLLQSGHVQALNYFNNLKELPIHLAVAACESYPLI